MTDLLSRAEFEGPVGLVGIDEHVDYLNRQRVTIEALADALEKSERARRQLRRYNYLKFSNFDSMKAADAAIADLPKDWVRR